MGCSNCKQKQDQQGGLPESGEMSIPLMPEAIAEGNYNGNFFFKLIAFGSVIVALPFIIVVLLCQVFVTFFLPKSKDDFTSPFINVLKKIVDKYAQYKAKKELKRREKEFSSTTSYDDYDVYDTKQYTPEEILSDAEKLDWVNLSKTNMKIDNNKKVNDE